MNTNKYIIKNLAPWMMDELIAFSKYSKFDVVFLRNQDEFYDEGMMSLKKNDVKVYIQPKSYQGLIKKLVVSGSFLLDNLARFKWDYNFVIGIKSILWFLKLDLSIFSESSNIHGQFATQAPLVALLIKDYYNSKPDVSFTFHAYDIYFDNKWFNLLIDKSTHAFSISDFNIQYVKKQYVASDKIQLSRLGVFRDNNLIEREHGKEKDFFSIGLLSWFIEKKGIIYLLEAIKELSYNEKTNIKLFLAGDGPLNEDLHSFVKINKLEHHVTFLGKIKGQDKQNFFNSLDAFVLPSISLKNDQDGIPVVLMEAISYSLPIISTDVSGIPEICINDYNGRLIPERNVSELSHSIRLISSNAEKYKKYSKNSYTLSETYDILINSKKKLKKINWI